MQYNEINDMSFANCTSSCNTKELSASRYQVGCSVHKTNRQHNDHLSFKKKLHGNYNKTYRGASVLRAALGENMQRLPACFAGAGFHAVLWVRFRHYECARRGADEATKQPAGSRAHRPPCGMAAAVWRYPARPD